MDRKISSLQREPKEEIQEFDLAERRREAANGRNEAKTGTPGDGMPSRGHAEKSELTCKPGSVEDGHSSGTGVTARLKQPTREHVRAARRV